MELWIIILVVVVALIAVLWATVAIIGLVFARKAVKEVNNHFDKKDFFAGKDWH